MSVLLTGAVKQRGPESGPLNHTLWGICDEADDFGFACPSIESIARASRCSVRQVIRRVKLLEKEGWIKVERKVFRGEMANAYFVDVDKLGVVHSKMVRRSPLWANYLRLMKRLEAHDKVSLRNGVLKFEKTPESVEVEESGDLFGDDFASDTMSLENTLESVQGSADLGDLQGLAAKRNDPEATEAEKDDSAGDKVSHDMCRPRHVTSDIEGKPFNVLPVINPFQKETNTPLTPQAGDGGDELILPGVIRKRTDANFGWSLGIAAAWVRTRCKIPSRSYERVIGEALGFRLDTCETDLKTAAELAAANYLEYVGLEANGLLRFQLQPRAFFAGGACFDQAKWGIDQKRGREMAGAAIGTRAAADKPSSVFEAEKVAMYLGRNAAALKLAGFASFSGRLMELADTVATADLEALDKTLQDVEDELVERLLASTSAEELEALRAAVDKDLAPYSGRMNQVQIAQVKQQSLEKRLMEAAKLPRLSLFYMGGKR